MQICYEWRDEPYKKKNTEQRILFRGFYTLTVRVARYVDVCVCALLPIAENSIVADVLRAIEHCVCS